MAISAPALTQIPERYSLHLYNATMRYVAPLPVSVIVFRERVAWQAVAGAGVAVCGSALLFL